MTDDDELVAILARLAKLRRERERAERSRGRVMTETVELMREARARGAEPGRLHQVTGLSRMTVNRVAPAPDKETDQ